jgi:hypothetical protein
MQSIKSGQKNSNLKHHAYEMLVHVYDKEEDALVPNVKRDGEVEK